MQLLGSGASGSMKLYINLSCSSKPFKYYCYEVTINKNAY